MAESRPSDLQSAVQVIDSKTVTDLGTPAAASLPWYAVRVKSRQEKVVAASLAGKGYEQFLPLYKKHSSWSDRKKVVELPLFSGYVFCRLEPEKRLPIIQIPGVVGILGTRKQIVPVPDSEMEIIHRILASGLPAMPWPYLKVGDRVRIEKGSMSGVEGILVEIRKELRVIVSVDMLRRSVGVEIDRDWLRPIK